MNEPRKYVERRGQKDWVVRSINIIAVIGWVFAMAAVTIAYKAQPATENMITRILKLNVVGYWNITLLRASFFALIASFLVCLIGFFANMTRHRRKTDRYNKSIIILGMASLVFVIGFIIRFNSLIF